MKIKPTRVREPLRSADALDIYLQEISSESLLSPEEEAGFSRRIQAAEQNLFDAALSAGVPLHELCALGDALYQGEIEFGAIVEVEPTPSATLATLEAVSRLEKRRLRLAARAIAVVRTDDYHEAAASLRDVVAQRNERVHELTLLRRHLVRVGELALGLLVPALRPQCSRDAVHDVEAAFGRPLRDLRKAARNMNRIARDLHLAKSELTRPNLRLVVAYARRFQRRGLPMADLVQEGNIGLMRAVDRFDHRVGTRFSTYATWWIRQAIQRALHDKGEMIRVPVHVHAELKGVARARAELHERLGRQPTDAEVAEHVGVTEARLDKLRKKSYTVSLDSPPLKGEGRDLSETIEDPSTTRPDEALFRSKDRAEVEALLTNLDPRERRVVEMHFGLHGRPYTLAEIGQRLSLTRERIRQIEVKALGKLQRAGAARRKGYEP